MPEYFSGKFGKQTVTINMDLENNKENKIHLYNLIYKTYFMKHRANINIETENCKIDYTNKQIIITPTSLGEGTATIKINGGDFDGTIYNINYNSKEKIEFTELAIKNMPNKLVYIEGENFDKTGLQIYGIINVNQYIISNYSILDGENLQVDQEYVTIECNGSEVQIPITVYSKEDVLELKVTDEKILDAIDEYKGVIIRRDGTCSAILLKELASQVTSIILPSNVEDISGLECFENLQQISLNKIDFIKSDNERIELPKYIYQLLTLWDENTAQATIYYDTYYFAVDVDKTMYINYNDNKKIVDIEMDYENEKAYITVDREIKENNVVRGGFARRTDKTR